MEQATKFTFHPHRGSTVLLGSGDRVNFGGDDDDDDGKGGTPVQREVSPPGLVVLNCVKSEPVKADAMILELNSASQTLFDCNPDNVHVRPVAVDVMNGVKSVACDVYAKCDLHMTVVPSSGMWLERAEGVSSSSSSKLTDYECVENVNTSRGLATLETHVVGEFQVLAVASQSTGLESSSDAREETTLSNEASNEEIGPVVHVPDRDVAAEVAMQSVENVAAQSSEEVVESLCENDATTDSGTVACDDLNTNVVHVAVEVQHSSQQDGSLAYGCSRCKFQCPYALLAKDHVKKHKDASLRYLCNVCGKSYPSAGNVARHRTSHAKVKPFSCPHCQRSFGQKAHLNRHLMEQEVGAPQDCKHCLYAAEYRCAMHQHYKLAHPSKPPVIFEEPSSIVWQCGVCDYECNSKKDLAQHMKHHTSQTPLNYSCDQCSFVTDFPCRLKRHNRSHTQERPYRCGLCDYRGSQVEHVIRHMRTVHREEPKYSLDSGDEPKVTTVLATSSNADELRKSGLLTDLPSGDRFSKDVENRKLFSCPFCDIGFQRPRNLLKHLDDIHAEEENRYICSVCQSQSETAPVYIEHLASHKPPSAAVEYLCSYCDFKTEKRRNFVYHMQAKHYKIVHFGTRNSSYGVSDLYPELALSAHCVVASPVHEPSPQDVTEDESETPLNSTQNTTSASQDGDSSQEVFELMDGDLVQIDGIIYRIESSSPAD